MKLARGRERAIINQQTSTRRFQMLPPPPADNPCSHSPSNDEPCGEGGSSCSQLPRSPAGGENATRLVSMPQFRAAAFFALPWRQKVEDTENKTTQGPSVWSRHAKSSKVQGHHSDKLLHCLRKPEPGYASASAEAECRTRPAHHWCSNDSRVHVNFPGADHRSRQRRGVHQIALLRPNT
jgi:hypothetical protein